MANHEGGRRRMPGRTDDGQALDCLREGRRHPSGSRLPHRRKGNGGTDGERPDQDQRQGEQLMAGMYGETLDELKVAKDNVQAAIDRAESPAFAERMRRRLSGVEREI